LTTIVRGLIAPAIAVTPVASPQTCHRSWKRSPRRTSGVGGSPGGWHDSGTVAAWIDCEFLLLGDSCRCGVDDRAGRVPAGGSLGGTVHRLVNHGSPMLHRS
jgi:hypothetical protein